MTTRTRLLLAIAYPLGIAIVSLAIPLALNVRDRVNSEVRSDAGAEAALIAANSAEYNEPAESANLQALAVTSAIRAQGRVVIVDAQGRLLADSAGAAQPGTSFVGRPEIRAAISGKRVQIERHSQALNADLLATAVPIVHAGQPEGAVRLTQSMAAVRSATRRAALGIAALAGIVLAVGIAGAAILAVQLSRSTQRLHDAAQRIAAGDVDARVPVEGSTDQRELALAFNTMTERIGRLLRAQEALVADASHQLRTPLTGTRLQVEEVLHAKNVAGARASAKTALVELDRLSRTVDELLVLSSDGSGAPHRSEVDLGAVAAVAAARWEGPAAVRDQVVALEVKAAEVVWASEEDITRSLDALIENAVAYSPQGSRIAIVANARSIEVLDEGPGIPPEDAQLVFERFRRGAASGSAPGSGLGLAIARQLARRNGGDVTIASRGDRPGARARLTVGDADA